ncbi:MAG: hypothetical protein ACI9BD_000003 [Candidatus Marinamargulisbacteria bacterium]|jgi:uncharacterized protein
MANEKLLNYLVEDCGISQSPVRAALSLFGEGATIPFVARYRKEKTGGLDETQLRQIQTRSDYYETLFSRQQAILKSIEEQGQLTDSLRTQIDMSRDKQALEDIYLPYKKRRKTKADIAAENGLAPLAQIILAQKATGSKADIVAPFFRSDGPVETAALALEGAVHIIAQSISDSSQHRQWIRHQMANSGFLASRITTKFKKEKTKFDMYADFSEKLKSAASHRVLAIRRGEKEKVLNWKIIIDDEKVLSYLTDKVVRNPRFCLVEILQAAIRDAYDRLLKPSLQTACFGQKVEESEQASKNLENLLLAAPTGAKVIMGIDPGFRTGCKIAIVNQMGQYQATVTIFPVPPHQKMAEAEVKVLQLIKQYGVELIAVGNGTGSKETMQFIKGLVKSHSLDVTPVVVNESGASVYSASELAVQEYPTLDVTVRGAISIAHRLQDPLAELVKIDPKAIGVGQYQHDVNQTDLKEALTFTTGLAVNSVGVDLNTASASLLTYVSGIGPTIAQNIVSYREKNGPFKDRKALLKVPKLGPKAYEQCTGFLRIKGAKNPLDDSAIHPESYRAVQQMAASMGCSVDTLIGNGDQINQLKLGDFVTEAMGLTTLQDIVKELLKPGLDPRAEFSYATFDDAVDDIGDLKEGMALEGVVTNVTNFGAFVDIGVHQDGLIHISKLSHTFVKNPHDVIAVGDRVQVKVVGVDLDLKRIQLARVLA